ncbi:MAG: Uncharacterized protein JWR17_2443 [Pseudomonas sp.]|jgi:hypothetical protein|uniref:hypothetical protein n=1 Tax=Pseudomonas sp. TaxID=306 RepID=UPI00262ECA4F|nr:hypothetical protein [Pseudomonas sp.]MDB6049697.1 Uncharacterized protein [Pseudomonas sp.]
MKRSILTAIVLMTLSVTAVRADNLQIVPSTGEPGTATPTPYPQVSPPSIPRTGGNEGNPPLLPKIDIPGPPKDQPLPGLQNDQPGSPPKNP